MNSPLIQNKPQPAAAQPAQDNSLDYSQLTTQLSQLSGMRIDPFAAEFNQSSPRAVGPLTIPNTTPELEPVMIRAGTPLKFSKGVKPDLHRPDQDQIVVTGDVLRPKADTSMVIDPDGFLVAHQPFKATIDNANIFFPGEHPDYSVRFMGLPAQVEKGARLSEARPLQMAV